MLKSTDSYMLKQCLDLLRLFYLLVLRSMGVAQAAAGIIASERKSPHDGSDADGRRVRRRTNRRDIVIE